MTLLADKDLIANFKKVDKWENLQIHVIFDYMPFSNETLESDNNTFIRNRIDDINNNFNFTIKTNPNVFLLENPINKKQLETLLPEVNKRIPIIEFKINDLTEEEKTNVNIPSQVKKIINSPFKNESTGMVIINGNSYYAIKNYDVNNPPIIDTITIFTPNDTTKLIQIHKFLSDNENEFKTDDAYTYKLINNNNGGTRITKRQKKTPPKRNKHHTARKHT